MLFFKKTMFILDQLKNADLFKQKMNEFSGMKKD